MSSNVRIQKVCAHCSKDFTARTTVTQYCSDTCAKLNYKRRKRDEKLEGAKQKTKQTKADNVLNHWSKIDMKKKLPSSTFIAPITNGLLKELLDIQEMAVVIGLSERTLHRLMKDKKFPRLRIGKRVLFQKEKVLEYLNHKFSNV